MCSLLINKQNAGELFNNIFPVESYTKQAAEWTGKCCCNRNTNHIILCIWLIRIAAGAL